MTERDRAPLALPNKWCATDSERALLPLHLTNERRTMNAARIL